MKIELKKLKIFLAGSEETYCFTTELWIDGKYQGSARNDGRGGCHIISPPSLEKDMNDWGKTLSPVVLAEPDMSFPQDAETLINDLIETHLVSKDLKKLFTKHIVYTKRGEVGVFQIKSVRKPAEVFMLKNTVEQMRTKFNIDKILNLIPFDEALKIYREQGR